MENKRSYSWLLFVCLTLPVLAQTPPKSPTAGDFHGEALVCEESETTYRMHADGTGSRLLHVLMRVQSEGAARQFGVLSIPFAAANETPHITMVRVHKADGSTVDTPAADAIDVSSEVTREAPLYSDLKEKHIPVKSLSVGDTLEYAVEMTIDKAEAPGEFWGANHFTAPGTLVVLAERLTLEFPKDTYVQVWSPNHKPEVTEQDGVRRYQWTVAQLVPPSKAKDDGNEAGDASQPAAPKDIDEDADGRKLPSVAWTTFHSWAAVGDWYRGLALGRSDPKDSLKAKAEELTKDAKTPEEQVKAIYGFVSSKTRYVGIDFGVGRYQPHAAAEVLANQYGDCKDKDTLLEALLRAKGFVTAPVLIGAGITPVPDVPSPAVFNHVITTVELPGGRIWLDSTPEVAPYGYLSPLIRDELALVVPASGQAALQKTPAAATYAFEDRFEAVGELDVEGKLTVVRALARSIAPAEWDKASQYVSSSSGFGGTTSKTEFQGADSLNRPIVLKYDYTRKSFGDWENMRILPLFPALEFAALGNDKKEPEKDIELGAPRKMVAVSRVRLPTGFHTDLPDPVHVKTDFATVDKTYRFDGQEIVVERSVVVLKKKLPKAEWKRYQQFSKDISLDSEPWIQLIKPAKPMVAQEFVVGPAAKVKGSDGKDRVTQSLQMASTKPDPSKPTAELPDGATVQELMQQAREQIQAMNPTEAVAALDRVKARNPDEQYLWANYGIVAVMQHNNDEAKRDYERELKNFPENPGAVAALAELETRMGDGAAARKTVGDYLAKHPDELKLAMYEAKLQTDAGDNLGALKTLQSAAEQNPEARPVRLQLSEALLRLDRKEEAAAVAKSAIDGSDDPLLMNNAAFVLARTGEDLTFAEDVSRKSIARLEERSAAITTAEVNSNSFAQSNTLIAAWDTLGWILFREEKYSEAKPLLAAAWRNNLRPEVGDHLGQLYEATGDKAEAFRFYSMAQASTEGAGTPAEARQHTRESLERLKTAGVKPPAKDAKVILQEERTYKLPKIAGLTGWGTFRLQIGAGSVVAAQRMTGDKKLDGLEEAIAAMKLPELLPPTSKALLLRSAVVSCSSISGCEMVLVPNSSLQTEQY
jgi:tetratricopeptide (TPR) repeat protein/transglutaminase-like putative cysteine protease